MAETACFMVHRAPPYQQTGEETGNRCRVAEMSNQIVVIRHHGQRYQIALFPKDLG